MELKYIVDDYFCRKRYRSLFKRFAYVCMMHLVLRESSAKEDNSKGNFVFGELLFLFHSGEVVGKHLWVSSQQFGGNHANLEDSVKKVDLYVRLMFDTLIPGFTSIHNSTQKSSFDFGILHVQRDISILFAVVDCLCKYLECRRMKLFDVSYE